MKPAGTVVTIGPITPAAFGRLCVETILEQMGYGSQIPAAFGRLCVETHIGNAPPQN